MKNPMLAFVAIITIASAGTSLYVANLENPTQVQIALGIAGAKIATTGANTLIEQAGRSKRRRSRRNQKLDDE